ncbi:hypothetical protein PoB_004433100 [Plakobranchus ocellatus]|uniref:Uncharacterized protein n=1 Tax=Plakobranchus ocellatus TaxID=259542 RepID=A0AAV4BBM5_9GAST|nr:hypothetical protein PoB_004433100 [Plakobranchus ocellatus]
MASVQSVVFFSSLATSLQFRQREVLDPNRQDTGRASWGSGSCPTGHPKDSPAQEVLNPNGLDPPYQPQRMVNPNGLDPPRQLKKLVNPNGLDPPDRLKLREKLDLAASEGITGMQNQQIASGGEQSIICTGVRNVQGQEVVPASIPSSTKLVYI